MPKYVLKQKRLSKTKTVVIFRRNYLDIKNFKKEDGRWIFEEKFNHYGVKCHLKIIIHSEDIFSMFKVDTKAMKIKGNHKCFGVFIRLPRQDPPFIEKNRFGCAEFVLSCSGKKLAYDNGKGIVNARTKKPYEYCITYSSSKTPAKVPSTVSWNASHPFQGGSVSPK
ncbi:hypothetical protein JYG23_04310 [Sedimentibacter sp. zth1]|uniref:hypothetical protein n=1 Tax=Sedimentibacter sp. zth1 TaxID=2816908 RepID=UPI001A92EAE4|nr:hypothetical protein [Sedimentibacter sp. zth1]QSX06685.1 hypothetical protein JYG23_04310 [Sedimentibacter sp. zth1]